MENVVYFRDKGPICYTGHVFYRSEDLVELPRLLLASELGWCWESGRRELNDDTYDNPNLQPVRPLSRLTNDNAELFIADLRERKADRIGRWINMFGMYQ